ncbi:MAG: translocation/assembly module TamB domain-containing protein [Bacteroidales bacterium]|nr:translocation/assembly module TamB domain-containing protein [Bacteroidales bacterium]
MLKNIKKSLKYFIIVAGIIILLPTLLYLVLQIPQVQTAIVQRITSHFSSELKSTISIESFHYRFFNRLTLNNILIKDNHNDTLLFSQEVSVILKGIDLKNNSTRLGKVTLIRPYVALITDSTGLMNLSWFLGKLKSPPDTVKKAPLRLSIDQIDFSNARFSLINHNGKKSKTRLDFNNMNFSDINGIIEDLNIENDTTSFNIYHLGFRENSGFNVRRMSSSVLLANQSILFNSFFLNCDSTILNLTRLGIRPDSSDSYKRFTEEVRLDILMERSIINTTEIAYFLPLPEGLNESVWISGKIAGTVSELRGRNIYLSYRDYTTLDCDFDFSGLPKIENAFIYIGVNSLNTNAKDFEKIRLPKKGLIIVPEALYKLGNVSFDGSFTGFTTDFVTYGKFSTDAGSLRTDISFRPEESERYRIKGLINGSDIDIGLLTDKSDLLGKLSMQANIDGYAYSFKKFAANLTGRIDSIEINSYKYRNIALNGSFTENAWDGSIKVADENIKLDVLGMFNFKNKLPEFDFTLNLADANLYKLNIDKLDTTANLTMLLTSNFKGSNIDNLDGEIKLLNSNYRKHNETLELYDFTIRTFSENNKPVLSLRTDFVNADIRGYYNFASIGGLIKSTLATLMPSQFPPVAKRTKSINNNFTFDINFRNTDKINNFFGTGILLADKSNLKGSVFTDSIISITGTAKSLSFRNNEFKDLRLNASTSGSAFSMDINTSTLLFLGQSDLKGFSVELDTKPDNFIFTINWDNKAELLNKGNFMARGSVAKSSSDPTKTLLMVEIDSTSIYARNNLWQIKNSSVKIDTNSVSINDLNISSRDRYYRIDGTISENPNDTLRLDFRGIDISPLNYLVNKKNAADAISIPLNFQGLLNGKIMVTNVYRNILLESDIVVNSFSMLGCQYGDISIKSALDNAGKIVKINAGSNLAGVKMLDIKGNYDPARKKIDLAAVAAKLPIDALNPLLKMFASGITGTASGKVNLSGSTDKMFLTGSIMAENASMKIDYLQTRYKLNDSVRFDKKGFRFNNLKLTDERGNPAILNGYVYHKNFKEYSSDVVINIPTPGCLVLNTKPKDNEMFYGTAVASGLTTIKAAPGLLSFDISARTGKGTKFNIPLTSGLSVSDYSFISFFDADSVLNKESGNYESINANTPAQAKKTGMEMNFDLQVTPDAEVQIIFDAKVGDVMKGRGTGDLNIVMTRKGDFLMNGDYVIEEGDYLFTLKNILNKSFSVENGGRIMFNGEMANAQIDLNAIYKIKTSLSPLVGGQSDAYSEREDVECQLRLTGKLFNPVVKLNIELPNSDEQKRAILRNKISTEEELSRQFLYLLITNSFLADESSSTTTSTAGTSAMAVTTTEMLSNQLSNWLSQINNDIDFAFQWRPGTTDASSQDLQFDLSTQLLNNKIKINSNLDYGIGGSAETDGQLTGDFDAEIRLTEKIRLKVFNRFNNTYSGRGPYTQGIGIFFREDFDKFSDLFKKKIKPEAKKEEEVTPKEETK